MGNASETRRSGHNYANRRRAREIALQLLYEMDLRPGMTPGEAIGTYPDWDDETPEAGEYAKYLVAAAAKRSGEIDSLIREHVVDWRTERMVAVDRAALRLALCEGLLEAVVPMPVAISEAVDLAKAFGTEDSGGFVNGVLGRIIRSIGAAASDDGKK